VDVIVQRINRNGPSADQGIIRQVIDVNAPPSRLWQVLTTPELMKKWMMPDIDEEQDKK
jgi:uncharacterized protein YndB with AHSA1/START domain